MWYRGGVGKGRQKVLPKKRIIFAGELVTHLLLIFILLLLLLKATRTDRWGTSSKATASKCTCLRRTLPYWVQHCYQSVRVCETVVNTKLQQWMFIPKSNSRLLVDSTSIWLANGDCCRKSCPLLRGLRHRTPSSPIYLSEEIHKPFALSWVFLLFSGGKSIVLEKKKRLPVVLFPHLCT